MFTVTPTYTLPAAQEAGILAQIVEEVRTGIRLEHVRQDLRYICISTFNVTDRERAQAKVRGYEEEIRSLLKMEQAGNDSST